MHLISLELENFRQHSNSKISFSDGITAIIGSNGSGKSTILEAITWAIYGTEAARGNKSSIKWNKAPARSKVRVELVFSIDSETFRVKRELNKAELYIEPNQTPIVISQDEVTSYLTSKLGMNRVEFFNTYFTGQKELDFLGNQKPIERRKFISKVLNYEKVREAQEQTRIKKNNISNEILGLQQALGNIDTLKDEKTQNKNKLSIINNLINEKKEQLEKNTSLLGKLTPAWTKLKSEREIFNKVSTELKFISEKFAQTSTNIADLTKEYQLLETKELKLKELEPNIETYTTIEKEILQQEELQKYEIERQKLLIKTENLEKEIIKTNNQINKIEENNLTQEEIQTKIELSTTKADELKLLISTLTEKWTSRKQEIKTIKKHKDAELNKLATQFSIIEQNGENGACPTCERPLKDEYNKVTESLQGNITLLSKDISSLILEEEELKVEPQALSESKINLMSIEKELDILKQNKTILLNNLKTIQDLKAQLTKAISDKELFEKQLEKLPKGFNSENLQELKEKFIKLKQIYNEVITLKAQIENKNKIKTNLEQNLNSLNETDSRKKELEESLNSTTYSEEQYKKLEEEVAQKENTLRISEKELLQYEGEVKQLNSILNKILAEEQKYTAQLELIKQKQEDVNYLIELDRFYGQFLEKLNNLARPELSEYASKFLSELTDGRYSMLELNERYEVCLYDDGEAKPVISGGEEDIANLCLRLAISQMIAQRSGKTLSLLILDEVFGSLDENRRNNVVSLLHKLTNNFEQIVLITHIDDLKESVDNTLKVEYDEENSFSTVTQNTKAIDNINLKELTTY